MKRTLLNCDQVFDVLTRGPFPTGEPEDDAVERHLRACHECRRLAEALRPAVALLHEAIETDEANIKGRCRGSGQIDDGCRWHDWLRRMQRKRRRRRDVRAE